MPRASLACSLLLALGAGLMPLSARAQTSALEYRGVCDASAAVAVGDDAFLVAQDEDNVLRLYRRDQPEPIDQFDFGEFLGAGDKEADIEAAARIGNRVYWITSHGRNTEGKERPLRQRLFAVELAMQDGKLAVTPIGAPYTRLLDDLHKDKRLRPFKLKDAAKLAPEAPDGLNIEGLAATPEGELLIGFRNPRRDGKALVVPLKNPERVVAGKRVKFGRPIELALDGRGIRSLERVGEVYLIVAGAHDDAGNFALYQWSGAADDPPKLLDVDLGDLRPEALIQIPGTRSIQLLSDDGGVLVDGIECKLAPVARRTFRSLIISR